MAQRDEADIEVEQLAEQVLRASRALVAVAARSLAAAPEDVTTPQFRALAILRTRGSGNLNALADQLGVQASTATRLCDRLVRKGLIKREPSPESGREVRLSLTAAGVRLVDEVWRRRRTDIERILAAVPPERRAELLAAFHAFADAAGEGMGEAPGWEML
jgi:DNA-binding MarR family transcriptional regulator